MTLVIISFFIFFIFKDYSFFILWLLVSNQKVVVVIITIIIISSSSNLLFVQLESLLIIYFSVSPIKMKRGDGDVTFFLIYPTGRYHSEYSDAHRYFSRFPIGSYWCYGDQ